MQEFEKMSSLLIIKDRKLLWQTVMPWYLFTFFKIVKKVIIFCFIFCFKKDDQEPNRMEFFKRIHYSENKGWSTPEFQAAYIRLFKL